LAPDAPREVKTAILLSWVVLVLDSVNNIYTHVTRAEPTDGQLFNAILAVVTLSSIAITALFIVFAARRRNWARIALLIWTVGSWCFWFFWPPLVADYSWWKWLFAGALVLSELIVLVLLFRGKGRQWYSAATIG
jgi:hypothetical protein